MVSWSRVVKLWSHGSMGHATECGTCPASPCSLHVVAYSTVHCGASSARYLCIWPMVMFLLLHVTLHIV